MIGLRLKPVAQLSRREAARELTALGEEISTMINTTMVPTRH